MKNLKIELKDKFQSLHLNWMVRFYNREYDKLSSYEGRLRELQSQLELSNEEVRILLYLLPIFTSKKIAKYAYRYGLFHFLELITGMDEDPIVEMLTPVAPLFQKGILKDYLENDNMLNLTYVATEFVYRNKNLDDDNMSILLAQAKEEYSLIWEKDEKYCHEIASNDSPSAR